jgi:hypothetical protein
MPINQQNRILLIEQLANSLWNFGEQGWGSGYHKSSKIIAKVLHAIINKAEVRVGLDAEIPPKFKHKVPYQLIEQLRQADITLDDLDKFKEQRDANADLLLKKLTLMLERGFKDIQQAEHTLRLAAQGQKMRIFNDEDIKEIINARFIKIDFSGFLCKNRQQFIATFLKETNITPKELIALSASMSEKQLNRMKDQLLFQKQVMLDDIKLLKSFNISAIDAINDLNRIATDQGTMYSHIRDFYPLIIKGLDKKLMGYLAVNVAKLMGEVYKVEEPVEQVAEIPFIQNLTTSAINATTYVSTYNALTNSFAGMELQHYSPEYPLGNQVNTLASDTILLAFVLTSIAVKPLNRMWARLFSKDKIDTSAQNKQADHSPSIYQLV